MESVLCILPYEDRPFLYKQHSRKADLLEWVRHLCMWVLSLIWVQHEVAESCLGTMYINRLSPTHRKLHPPGCMNYENLYKFYILRQKAEHVQKYSQVVVG